MANVFGAPRRKAARRLAFALSTWADIDERVDASLLMPCPETQAEWNDAAEALSGAIAECVAVGLLP